MSRVTSLAVMLAACSGPARPADVLTVDPASLDFGGVAVGDSSTLTLGVRNTSHSPVPLQLKTSGPFRVQPATLVLGDEEGAALEVRFTPSAWGPAEGGVEVAPGLDVPARGVGLARDCAAVPEGTGCATRCIAQGACRAGVCVGAARSCEDTDLCTVDACDEEKGCMHPPVECPSAPCHAASCIPSIGCVLSQDPDGTECGEKACAWADQCVIGSCLRRMQPNVETSCRYRAVVATANATCAATLGGELRCWGRNDSSLAGVPEAAAVGPTKLPGFGGLTVLGASGSFVCGSSADGGVACTPDYLSPTAGAAPGARQIALSEPYWGWIVSELGVLQGWYKSPLQPEPGPPLAGVAVTTFQARATLDERGAFAWNGLPVSLGAPATHIEGAGYWVLVMLDGGAVLRVGASEVLPLVDAGAVAVGATDREHCLALKGGVVQCIDVMTLGRRQLTVPGEITQLTTRGSGHLCAVTAAGEVWCWGDNRFGQLGQPTTRPLGVRYLDARGVTGLVAGTLATESDGHLYAWGVGWLMPDGGRLGAPDFDTPFSRVDLGPVPGRIVDSNIVLADGGEVYSLLSGVGLVDTGQRARRCDGLGHRGCQTACWSEDGKQPLFGDDTCGHEGCLLSPSGEVRCIEVDSSTRIESGPWLVGTTEPVVAISRTVYSLPPCLLLESGAVGCLDHAWLPLRPIPGLRGGARAVAGSRASGCALGGAMTVQCWGNNYMGQLGREGPWSTAAVDVPMPEPVAELSGNGYVFCVRFVSGRAACWGDNSYASYAPVLLHSDTPLRVER